MKRKRKKQPKQKHRSLALAKVLLQIKFNARRFSLSNIWCWCVFFWALWLHYNFFWFLFFYFSISLSIIFTILLDNWIIHKFSMEDTAILCVWINYFTKTFIKMRYFIALSTIKTNTHITDNEIKSSNKMYRKINA